MQQRWYGAVCVVVGILVTPISGQTDKAASNRSVTVVGCLQRNDNSGTLGTTIPESAATPESAPTRANSGEPAPGFQLAAATPLRPSRNPKALTVYVLNGSDAQLSGHLGRRVRITGTVVPNVAGNAQAGAVAGITGRDQLKGDITRIKVTAIETVASSCAAPQTRGNRR
jgi:hypothetical protein